METFNSEEEMQLTLAMAAKASELYEHTYILQELSLVTLHKRLSKKMSKSEILKIANVIFPEGLPSFMDTNSMSKACLEDFHEARKKSDPYGYNGTTKSVEADLTRSTVLGSATAKFCALKGYNLDNVPLHIALHEFAHVKWARDYGKGEIVLTPFEQKLRTDFPGAQFMHAGMFVNHYALILARLSTLDANYWANCLTVTEENHYNVTMQIHNQPGNWKLTLSDHHFPLIKKPDAAE